MENLRLTENNARQYFKALYELDKSDDEFPVDLDGVWELVYSKKENSFRELKKNFINGVDYNLLQNDEVLNINELANGIKITVKLSVSCLEYFIVRKNRPVFDVYREIRKEYQKQQISIPQTYSEALKLAYKQAEQLELQAPKIKIIDTITNSDRLSSMTEVAGIYNMGLKTLYKFLREHNVIQKNINKPYQKYIDKGMFEYKIDEKNGRHYCSTIVKGKGIEFIGDLLNKNKYIA